MVTAENRDTEQNLDNIALKFVKVLKFLFCLLWFLRFGLRCLGRGCSWVFSLHCPRLRSQVHQELSATVEESLSSLEQVDGLVPQIEGLHLLQAIHKLWDLLRFRGCRRHLVGARNRQGSECPRADSCINQLLINDVFILDWDVLLPVPVVPLGDGPIRKRFTSVESVHALIHGVAKGGSALLPELDVLLLELLKARVLCVDDALEAIKDLLLCMFARLWLPAPLSLGASRLTSLKEATMRLASCCRRLAL